MGIRLETGEFDFWKAVVVGAVTSGHAEPESVADRAVLKFRERAYDESAGTPESEPAQVRVEGVWHRDIMNAETSEEFERSIRRVRITSMLGMSAGAVRLNVLERIRAALMQFERTPIDERLRGTMIQAALSDLKLAGYELTGQAGEALAYVVQACVDAVIAGSARRA